MAAPVGKRRLLALCLIALACGPKREESAPAPPGAAATIACPICGTAFPRDRGVPVPGATVTVCSQGCVIRYEVSKLPPAAGPGSPEAGQESRTDENR
jgi:hypothetical protein